MRLRRLGPLRVTADDGPDPQAMRRGIRGPGEQRQRVVAKTPDNNPLEDTR